MSNNFVLILDTTGPANPSVSIEGGATFATNQLVNLTIGTTDNPTTGYQMRIWGNVDTAHNTNIQATEGASQWITYQTSFQVRLSNTDGTKTVTLKIRDDVHNESSQVSDSIILDSTLPVVTITGPDVFKISKITGKNQCSFSFVVDTNCQAYKVKVVSSTGSAHTTGAQIGIANGSTFMSGATVNAATPVNCIINGADLEIASAGDSSKIIKVFAQDMAGNWSS